MPRSLSIDTSSAVPIWSQIEEGVRRLVASGALAPGAAVPSVRDMARDLRVNPATVAKAYQRLTDQGVLTVKRGDGTYVADSLPALPAGERARRLSDGAIRYASLALTIGASREDASEELRGAFRKLSDRVGKGEKR